jgi:DNA-binding transcriptional MerR regulator
VNARRTHQVKEVSRLAGVSIRTLHDYEEIELLVPTRRTDAGYRLCTDDDLLRLQQILIGRELGLPLEEIRVSLDDPGFNRREALLEQGSSWSVARKRRPRRSPPSMRRSPFGSQEEGKWKRSSKVSIPRSTRRRRGIAGATRMLTRKRRADRAEREEISRDVAELMRAGEDPSDPVAMAVAERHRLSIDRWFYPCCRETHLGLASLYESDPRFTAAMDAHASGLTAFLVAAIRANASRR